MISEVDLYLTQGCMRCPLGATPDCKVHAWSKELGELRRILLACGLVEEIKWSQPCYTYHGSNVVILSALKGSATLGFFKGALLQDTYGLLHKPGPNSHASRRMEFTDVKQILAQEADIKACIFEAIEVEKAGLKVETSPSLEVIPDELQEKFVKDPAFQAAFEALTPGRQRGYILYFGGAKQAKTRRSRIEKYVSKIFEGKGFHDR